MASFSALAAPSSTLLGVENPASWPIEARDNGTLTLVSPPLESVAPWNELIVSWNVEPPGGSGLRVEAQAILPGHRATAFYPLGNWSLGEGAPWPRTSVTAPGDADGRVKTDTLALTAPAIAVRLRLTLGGELARHPDRLRRLLLSLDNTAVTPPPRPARPQAWGLTLEVPERSQIAHPEGEAWCSPTCVSMTLAWWAKTLDRPDLDRTVPQVAAGVEDPAWPGTGNWPFNTAYAATFPGMVAAAVRLRDLRDVEDLIVAGIPVAMSVNAPALRGEFGRQNGHLILAVGFTADGDLVANDPYARLEKGQPVRRTYRRANVERAWASSHRLTYLIAPESRRHDLPITWRGSEKSPR